MKRHFAIGIITLLLCAFAAWSDASAAGLAKTRLIPEQEAQTIGLTRAWFAQAPVDGDREEITSATLLDGTLFTTTERGLLTAIDAEAGTILWTQRVGEAKLTPPGVNSKIVAILCGTKLVVFDRFNGKKLAETFVGGQPSSGPVVGENEIFVPLFSQRVYAYPLKKVDAERPALEKAIDNMKTASEGLKLSPAVEKTFADAIESKRSKQYQIEPLDETLPFSCPSLGVSLVAPTLGTQSNELDRIAWTTNEGWLLIGELRRNQFEDALQLLYKLQITSTFSYVNSVRAGTSVFLPNDDVASSPFYLKDDVSRQNMNVAPEKREGGLFLVGTKTGRVFAMNDANGKTRWMFLTTEAVSERIFALGDRAYVPTAKGEYFAISLVDGKEIWKTTDVRRFLAASATRLYVVDGLDRLVALDAATGTRLKTLKVGVNKFQIFNKETDRVYFVSADGLVQCLRETQQIEPLRRCETCAEVKARLDAEKYADDAKAPTKPTAAPANNATVPADDEDDAFEADDEDDVFGDDSAADEEEDDVFGDDSEEEETDAAPADEEEDPFAANSVNPFDGEI